VVGLLRLPKAPHAARRERDEKASPVVRILPPLDEAVARKPGDGPRHAARADEDALGDVGHAQPLLGHRFYAELGPLTRNGAPDRATVAACFERHEMTLLGPPLSPD
jgi:hypothetical protein